MTAQTVENFLVLSVNLGEAFDLLKWSFILKILNLYGFVSTKIINWIKILCKNKIVYLSLIMYLVVSLRKKKGVRQGDPLSLTIFMLCTQYLSEMLRQSEEN